MTNLPDLYDLPRSAWTTPAQPVGTSGLHTSIPGDISAEYYKLIEAYQQAEQIAAEADGRWGPFGWDAATGLIPGVGACYTGFTALRLQRCAALGRCSFGTRVTGFLLAALDIGVGLVIGVGDVIDALFRSGAIHAGMIQSDIRNRLVVLKAAQEQLDHQGYLTDADVARLRDLVFRGGRSETGQGLRNLIAFGVLLFLLYSCAG